MAELKHLRTAWDVDRHIVLDSAEKLVLIRFSGYEDPPSEVLLGTAATAMTAPTTTLSCSAGGGEASRKRSRAGADGENTPKDPAVSPLPASPAAVVAGQEHYLRTQQMDALLVQLAPKVRKYCVIYAVDTNEVPEFNAMYELGHDRDPFAVMFFFRGQHIRVDVGTGNNNKINFFAFEDWEEDFLPIVNAAYRSGKLGKNMASSEKKFSTVSLRR